MRRALLLSGTAIVLVAGSALTAPSALAGGTLPNGFTAKVVAQSGQTITGDIDASGFDLGIYIGPGVHDVRVLGARVTGADDQGILVQDARDVLVRGSTVEGNALHHDPGLQEVKAISLVGTRDVAVIGNTVAGNGDGGIGVYDDGPTPGQFTPAPTRAPVPSIGNLVTRNTVTGNLFGCGIVVAGKNPGGGLRAEVVSHNTVTGGDPATGGPPVVGGIVVAGGTYGAVAVTGTVVLGNTVTGGFIPGISLHGSDTASLTRTLLIGNVLRHNGAGAGGNPTGIEIAGSPGPTRDTQVLGDRVVDDFFGVFHVGDTDTHIAGLSTSGVTVPVGP